MFVAALYLPYRGSAFRSLPRECVSLRTIIPGRGLTFRISPRECLSPRSIFPTVVQIFVACPGLTLAASILPTDVKIFVALTGNVSRCGPYLGGDQGIQAEDGFMSFIGYKHEYRRMVTKPTIEHNPRSLQHNVPATRGTQLPPRSYTVTSRTEDTVGKYRRGTPHAKVAVGKLNANSANTKAGGGIQCLQKPKS